MAGAVIVVLAVVIIGLLVRISRLQRRLRNLSVAAAVGGPPPAPYGVMPMPDASYGPVAYDKPITPAFAQPASRYQQVPNPGYGQGGTYDREVTSQLE